MQDSSNHVPQDWRGPGFGFPRITASIHRPPHCPVNHLLFVTISLRSALFLFRMSRFGLMEAPRLSAPLQCASNYGGKAVEAAASNMWFYLEQVKQCKKIDPSFIAFQRSGESGAKSRKD